MPQNKPMKIQWITVNGRQVPLVLPQTYSYEIEDWKVTSDRDPLPVVEYGTTAGGIVVPKRVSDEGHELTQLTGSNAKVIHKIENDDILTTTDDYRYLAIGSGTGVQVSPVDVRKFKDKMVVFKNNMNDSVASVLRMYADLDKGASSINQIFNLPNVNIPAGESYIWSSIEYPVLKLPFIGIACQAKGIGNSGTVDVLFLGGVL